MKDDSGKIKCIEEKLVYSSPDNPWIKLYFDYVEFPDGSQGRYNRIIEFNNIPGVIILPINEKGEIGLIKTYRYGISAWTWELPRGFGSNELSPQESALKELGEETGMHGDMTHIGKLFLSSGFSKSAADFFIAKNLRQLTKKERQTLKPEASEAISELRFFSLEKIKEGLEKGEITDIHLFSAIGLAEIKKLL